MTTLATAAPEPRRNGAKLASIEVARRESTATHHGVPVLTLHVGDPVPTPRAPAWYAVEVNPDLARHLLTLNHPDNRRMRDRRVHVYASDMVEGLWEFSPEAVVFSVSGILQDGQNRLMAVTEAGRAQWLLMTFGWPDDVINVINRAASRTNQDTFRIAQVRQTATLASAMALVSRYETVRASNPARTFSGIPVPSSQAALTEYASDPEGWHAAVLMGERVYDSLDKGLSPTVWAAAQRIIALARDAEAADAFLDEVRHGTGSPRSASRTLGDYYRRRPIANTKTGDSREPLENIIRGFNAWRAGKTMSLVTRPGFELSPVR